MKKFIRRFLQSLLRMTENRKAEFEDSNIYVSASKHSGSIKQTSLSNSGFTFTVHNATGGKVVEMSNYNPKTDRYTNNLYVITDNEDFGSEIGMIISRESLTR